MIVREKAKQWWYIFTFALPSHTNLSLHSFSPDIHIFIKAEQLKCKQFQIKKKAKNSNA